MPEWTGLRPTDDNQEASEPTNVWRMGTEPPRERVMEKQPTNPPAATVADTVDLRYLDPRTLRFFHRGATLHVAVADQATHLNVAILRAFPLSDPDRYLSVRDNQGDDIGLIADPAGLDPESRRLVDDALRRRYVLPVVQRILGLKERFETVEWDVETDRGHTQFVTRNLRDNVVRPAKDRCILTDVDGNRYDIPSLGALDIASRARALRHL